MKIKRQPKPDEGKEGTKSDQNSSITRLKNDIKNFKEMCENYHYLKNVVLQFPIQNSVNPVHIVVSPQTGFYSNSRITFVYTISEEYPYKYPEVECKQRVFHPNIDATRKVCLSILRGGWLPNKELVEVVEGLCQILESLSEQDLQKPLDATAAKLMKENREQFQKVVISTMKGQPYDGREFDKVWIGK